MKYILEQLEIYFNILVPELLARWGLVKDSHCYQGDIKNIIFVYCESFNAGLWYQVGWDILEMSFKYNHGYIL